MVLRLISDVPSEKTKHDPTFQRREARYIDFPRDLPLMIEVKLPDLRIGENESFDCASWHQSIHRNFQDSCSRRLFGNVIDRNLFAEEEDLVELLKERLSDSPKSSRSEAENLKNVLLFTVIERLCEY